VLAGGPTVSKRPIDIALRRDAVFSRAQGALGRRALVGRVEWDLAERYGISAEEAFARLGRPARNDTARRSVARSGL